MSCGAKRAMRDVATLDLVTEAVKRVRIDGGITFQDMEEQSKMLVKFAMSMPSGAVADALAAITKRKRSQTPF